MTLKQVKNKIQEIQNQHPDSDEWEMGPIFWSCGEEVIAHIEDVKVTNEKEIGIVWMC